MYINREERRERERERKRNIYRLTLIDPYKQN